MKQKRASMSGNEHISSELTPQDFHKVLKQQDREIRELKLDKQRQRETNAVFSEVITSQGAAQKRSEEDAVLYCYELTSLPRDDSPESKRAFVMWCTEQAGIPIREVSATEYVDVRGIYGVQTAIIKLGNKGNRTKMSKWMQFFKARNPSSTTAEMKHGTSTKLQVGTKKQQIREKEGTT